MSSPAAVPPETVARPFIEYKEDQMAWQAISPPLGIWLAKQAGNQPVAHNHGHCIPAASHHDECRSDCAHKAELAARESHGRHERPRIGYGIVGLSTEERSLTKGRREARQVSGTASTCSQHLPCQLRFTWGPQTGSWMIRFGYWHMHAITSVTTTLYDSSKCCTMIACSMQASRQSLAKDMNRSP